MQGDYRVGDWIVHPSVNTIECDGEAVHLEPKVMQVLSTLAADAGEVVTREQLRNAIWRDVFVGEDVLIRAISELRRAFADDPKNPHTIQTIPRVGYRLIAMVSEIAKEPPVAMIELPVPPEPTVPPVPQRMRENPLPPTAEVATGLASEPYRTPRRILKRTAVISAAAAGVLLIALAAFRFAHQPAHSTAFVVRPLTTYPGFQLHPDFSPDGSAVAFVWRKAGERNGHIYVKQIGSEDPSRLTSGDSEELSPSWSPDGHSIAFVRHSSSRSTITIIPAIGGSENEVYTLPTNAVSEYGGLTWTKDGENLIFPQKASYDSPSVLVELNLKNRSPRAITNPPHDWDGDWGPEVSPDGNSVAFVRGPESATTDVYVMTLPNGTPHRLTGDNQLIVGLAWTYNGSSILFSSNRSGSMCLWRVSAKGGSAQREPSGSDGAEAPAVARQGARLAYSRGEATWSIAAIDLGNKEASAETEILTSSQQDAAPHVSPSGDRLAFQSWRSGSQEIWSSGIDGNNPVQLTNSGLSAGSPSWSPDGKSIAFDARSDSFSHIFAISAFGGAPRQLTKGNYNDVVPSWSSDGRWIYFGSRRSGALQIWRMPADASGAAQQLTTSGAIVGIPDEEGRWLYFARPSMPGVWRIPIGGGPEQKICDGPPSGYADYWTLSHGILYTLTEHGAQRTIDRVDPATGRAQILAVLKHDPTLFAGLTIAPDGKHILFAELVRGSTELTLVEHFR